MNPAPAPVETREPILDGVRGVAILSVLAFHLRVPHTSWGWMGVNLFFVLSGYLITRILIQSRGSSNFFRVFYARRALRIFPIYFVALAIVTAWGLATNQSVADVGWYLVYAQNYVLGANGFNVDFPIEFHHTWSLAVEEQFYMLWPAVVFLFARGRLLAVCLAMWIGGILTKYALTGRADELVWSSLPSQLDPLGAGAFLAILMAAPSGRALAARWAPLFFVAGGAGLLLLARAIGPWTTPDYSTVAGVTATVFMSVMFAAGLATLVTRPDTLLAKPFANRALAWVGQISYGLYLYHWPVSVAIDDAFTYQDKYLRAGLKLALIFGLAILSWRFFESPINSLKSRFRHKYPDRPPAEPEEQTAPTPAVLSPAH